MDYKPTIVTSFSATDIQRFREQDENGIIRLY
jgi:hypothetical protein